MAFLTRIFRTFWIGILAFLLVGVPAILLVASKSAQNYLRSERHFGALTLRFHGAKVSPFLWLEADSAAFVSPEIRVFVSSPSIHLLGGSGSPWSRAAARVSCDSAQVRIFGGGQSQPGPAVFPGLRFPVPVTLAWRVAQLVLPGGHTATVEKAEWKSRGMVGLRGRFRGIWAGKPGDAPLAADFNVESRWRGGNVRYRVEMKNGADSVRVAGRKDKGNLALGEDSVIVAVTKASSWLPPAVLKNAPPLGRLRAHAAVDWKKRRVSLAGSLRTGAFHLLEAGEWEFEVHETALGGALELSEKGAGQELHWKGRWEHPDTWLAKPDWNRCQADFSGGLRGFRWQEGAHALPIEGNISWIRLKPGRVVEARVVTADSSHFVIGWNGAHPGRAECAGSLSDHERWALVWTDTNVAYHSAMLSAVWENGRIQGKARIQGARGYGGEADSIDAEVDVNPTVGLSLRQARLHHQGRVFRGSGFVEWGGAHAKTGTALGFELSHPEFGHAHFSMPHPDTLEAVADGVQAARFPYRPLQPFARFRPWVDGRFAWNIKHGVGQAEARVSFAYGSKGMRARLQGDWDRDSLRVRDAEWVTGTSRLAASAAAALGPHSLAGLGTFRPADLGAWRVAAENLRLSDLLDLIRSGSAPAFDAVLDGSLESDSAAGLRGTLKAADVRWPGLHGVMEVAALSVTGRGDTLRVSARTLSARQPLLQDTVEAAVSGIRSAEPRVGLAVRGPLSLRWTGSLPGWKELKGNLEVTGKVPLGPKSGALEDVALEGDLSTPLSAAWSTGLRFSSRRFGLRYAAALDTQWLSGDLSLEGARVRASDLRVRHSQGGELQGKLDGSLQPLSARVELQGSELRFDLPDRRSLRAQGLSARLTYAQDKGLSFLVETRSGSFRLPQSPVTVEGGFEKVRLEGAIPPEGATSLPRLLVRAQIHDFLFRYKIGLSQVQAFVLDLKPKKGAPKAGTHRAARPWDLDVGVEAVGGRNRVDTDILRMAFVGDLAVKGVYPYTLFRGKFTGLKGEIFQPGRAYEIRDFELKWENSTLEEGTIYLEGDKQLKADCLANTQRTCAINVKLDGRLDEMNFSYDTDCGQGSGEPIPPSALLNSVSRGCYTVPLGGEGGKAVVGMLEDPISRQLSKAGRWVTGGFIDSTRVRGLGSLVGGDTASLESVALEVQSKEKFRMSVQARAGYFPEKNLPDPWEYRLSAKYRPPVEKWLTDSAWQARFQNRLYLETGVQTQLDRRNLDVERRVSEQVGLRYRYRFWDLW